MAKDICSKNDLTWEVDNKFIPKYIPNDLNWHKRDGLGTWCLKNKCETDLLIILTLILQFQNYKFQYH